MRSMHVSEYVVNSMFQVGYSRTLVLFWSISNQVDKPINTQLWGTRMDRAASKLSFRCEGRPDVNEYTCTNAKEIFTQNADKSLINDLGTPGNKYID